MKRFRIYPRKRVAYHRKGRTERTYEVAPHNRMMEVMKQLLIDRGLLGAAGDAVDKVDALAGLLDDFADFIGIREPYAETSIQVCWKAADELRASLTVSEFEIDHETFPPETRVL